VRRQSRPLVPPIVSVALVVAFGSLLVGFGLGYRLGRQSAPSPPGPTPSVGAASASAPGVQVAATASPDLQSNAVSDRLQRAAARVAPRGWEVCRLAASVTCGTLQQARVDFTPNGAAYRLGDRQVLGMTATQVSSGHLVVVAYLGRGSASATLLSFEADGLLTDSQQLLPIAPGDGSVDYFDLGDVIPGRYALGVDFLSLPVAGASLTPEQYLLAGFSVDAGRP
jgi:hypothetical protein